MKLDDIEKLIDKASPGPWEHKNHYVFGPFDETKGILIANTFIAKNGCEDYNAAFIAASRELMPRLLKVVRAAQNIGFIVHRTQAFGGNDSFASSASVSIAKMNNILTALAELEQT